MRILIVEDDIIQQQVLACFLLSNGFQVETASSGLEAIRKAHLDTFHVILMDHAMPDVDGLSAAALIHRNRPDHGFPWLIALSANVSRVIEEGAGTSPVFDVLERKPWRPDRLLELLRSCSTPAKKRTDRDTLDAYGLDMEYSVAEAKIVDRYESYFNPNRSSSPVKLKVLLVDRDPALLSEFNQSLAASGYEVDRVSSKAEALERISSQRYDVVLADYLTLDRYCGSAAGFAKAAGAPLSAAPPAMAPSMIETAGISLAPQPLHQPIRRMHILVVDNNDINREIVASIIRADGSQVTCVDSGEGAVSAALATEFDVVLMNVRMPVTGGPEAARRIRAEAGLHACVPIIGMTSQSTREEIEFCLAAGMDGHLRKPPNSAGITSVITRAGAIKRRECAHHQAAPATACLEEPALGSDFPALDQSTYDCTTSCLGAAKAAEYRQMLADKTEALLRKLTRPADATSVLPDIVDEVHALGGSAGLFGFVRLTEMSRRYEGAVLTEASDVPEHVQGLIAALEVTLLTLRRF